MDNEDPQLRARLEQLDEEIQRTVSVDEEGRRILRRVQQDVQDLLARSGEAPSPHSLPVTERLRQGIEHFEVTHPVLAGLMEDVVNALSAMGI